MRLSHRQLIYLYKNILEAKTKDIIDDFILYEMERRGSDYNSESLWIEDQRLGGVGGYCMPIDATINPYPGGVERSLYRPLQYARIEIQIADVRRTARYVIQYSGMYLEGVCREVIRKDKFMGDFRCENTTLGKAITKIEKAKIVDEEIIIAMREFVKVYNMSKHEVNQNADRTCLFNAYDGITAYFSARVLGLYLLRNLKYPQNDEKLEICNLKRYLTFN